VQTRSKKQQNYFFKVKFGLVLADARCQGVHHEFTGRHHHPESTHDGLLRDSQRFGCAQRKQSRKKIILLRKITVDIAEACGVSWR